MAILFRGAGPCGSRRRSHRRGSHRGLVHRPPCGRGSRRGRESGAVLRGSHRQHTAWQAAPEGPSASLARSLLRATYTCVRLRGVPPLRSYRPPSASRKEPRAAYGRSAPHTATRLSRASGLTGISASASSSARAAFARWPSSPPRLPFLLGHHEATGNGERFLWSHRLGSRLMTGFQVASVWPADAAGRRPELRVGAARARACR